MYGDIRAWDVYTGKLVWSFHTVPRPGEPGVETWEGDSWKDRSGTNVWAFFTVDVERGLVFAPIGSPTPDYYGADRKGTNLYGNSIVALDASSGRLRWYRSWCITIFGTSIGGRRQLSWFAAWHDDRRIRPATSQVADASRGDPPFDLPDRSDSPTIPRARLMGV